MIIGWIATIVDDDTSEAVLPKNICLGVVGSIVGGVAGRALEESSSYMFGNISMLLAIIGGMLAIMITKGLKKRTTD